MSPQAQNFDSYGSFIRTLDTKTNQIPDQGPGTPSIPYVEMDEKWGLISDLIGGTGDMRNAGEAWLPREERESFIQYRARLGRSYLYNAYANTVDRVVAKPFSKNVILKGEEDLPEQLAFLETDADGQGGDITQVAREVFELGVAYGISYIFVDYPYVEGINLATQRQQKVHPYFVVIHPRDLIGWRTEKNEATGQPEVVDVRIKEELILPAGEYGEVKKEVVFCFRGNGTWTRYLYEDEDDAWTVHSEGTHTYPGVPLIPFYTHKMGPMLAEPALMDLAWLNLCHWQSYSDQRNILRIARMPILHQAGVTEEELEEPITLGPFNAVRSIDPDAKMSFVEHSGKAIGAGRDDLKDLEIQMEVLGMQPFVQPAVKSRTATEVVGVESRTMTTIQAWIRSLENVLETAYMFAATWVGVELPEDFAVDVFNEFGLSFKSEQDIRALDAARMRGDISHTTYLRELKRRGIISDDISVAQEVEDKLRLQEPLIAEAPPTQDLGDGEQDFSVDMQLGTV